MSARSKPNTYSLTKEEQAILERLISKSEALKTGALQAVREFVDDTETEIGYEEFICNWIFSLGPMQRTALTTLLKELP
jgi:hypothetical protein